MIKIKISTDSPDWPLIRQTPGSSGAWEDCLFFVNQDVDECDWWFVCENLSKSEATMCPPGHIIFITAEPPRSRTYDPKFLGQFSAAITSHKDLPHPKIILVQQALPWHIGVRRDKDGTIKSYMNFDDFSKRGIENHPKSKLASVISSDKKYTRGHRERLMFVDHLMKHLEGQVDLYGRGFAEVEDKWQAIAPYKYHIVLENSAFPHYFTEKLSDAFLGWSYPIYYGCSNIHEYFPPSSLVSIDISNPRQAVDQIKRVIFSDAYEKQIGQIEKARELVLRHYNLFPFLAEYVKSEDLGRREKTHLRPEKYEHDLFARLGRLYRTIRHYGPRKIYQFALERYC